MDTILTLPSSFIDNIDSIHPAELTATELSTIEQYIAITREVIESKQLFDVLYFNLLCLRNNFTLTTGDTVEMLPSCPLCTSEDIAVNALVINLISSAKTLTEFLRSSATRWLEKDSDNKDVFNRFASEIYDSSINYRILMNLRDFAQHGNLPVSFKENRYSFDVLQILSTPHFNLNKQSKLDMENFISKFNLSEIVPCLALTITLADFIVKVIDIYRKYLSCIKSAITDFYNKIKNMISSNPTIVCQYNEQFKGHIIYASDDTYHTFNTNDNPNKMINEYQRDVSIKFKDENFALEYLKESVKTIDNLG